MGSETTKVAGQSWAVAKREWKLILLAFVLGFGSLILDRLSRGDSGPQRLVSLLLSIILIPASLYVTCGMYAVMAGAFVAEPQPHHTFHTGARRFFWRYPGLGVLEILLIVLPMLFLALGGACLLGVGSGESPWIGASGPRTVLPLTAAFIAAVSFYIQAELYMGDLGPVRALRRGVRRLGIHFRESAPFLLLFVPLPLIQVALTWMGARDSFTAGIVSDELTGILYVNGYLVSCALISRQGALSDHGEA